MAKGDARVKAVAARLVDKYLAILGWSGPKPAIKLSGPLGVRWAGRCHSRTYRVFGSANGMATVTREVRTTVELHRKVLGNARTMERVIAHEVVHHVQYHTPGGGSRVNGGHGPDFLAMAETINAVAGKDFVTVRCGEDYEIDHTTRAFYVLVQPVLKVQGGEVTHNGEYMCAWAPTLNERVLREVVWRRDTRQARVFMTREGWIAQAKQMGRGRLSGVSSFAGAEAQETLRKLYHEGEQVDVGGRIGAVLPRRAVG